MDQGLGQGAPAGPETISILYLHMYTEISPERFFFMCNLLSIFNLYRKGQKRKIPEEVRTDGVCRLSSHPRTWCNCRNDIFQHRRVSWRRASSCNRLCGSSSLQPPLLSIPFQPCQEDLRGNKIPALKTCSLFLQSVTPAISLASHGSVNWHTAAVRQWKNHKTDGSFTFLFRF